MRYNLLLASLVVMVACTVGIGPAHAQVFANVTSDTANGAHTEGVVDVRLTLSEYLTIDGFNIIDERHGFDELTGAHSVTTTQIGSSHYALVAANSDNGVQIIDITDPANPVSTANITDREDGFDELTGAHSVTTTQIGSSHYALVASYIDRGVQIIDITDPARPINPLLPFI